MKLIIIVMAICAVLALSAGGRALIAWLAQGFKPVLGIVILLLSAHYTIFKHLITPRSIIYPTLVKNTVFREQG